MVWMASFVIRPTRFHPVIWADSAFFSASCKSLMQRSSTSVGGSWGITMFWLEVM